MTYSEFKELTGIDLEKEFPEYEEPEFELETETELDFDD